jgi:hypothetical protein
VGLVYLLLGCLIVVSTGGALAQIIALLAVAAVGGFAFLRCDQLDFHRWVTRAFIGLDVIVVPLFIIALLG